MKWLLLSVSLVLINACSTLHLSQTSGYDSIGEFKDNYAFVYDNGYTGMIDIDGKEVIPPIYDSIEPFDGRPTTTIYKNNYEGLIAIDGTVIIAPEYDFIGAFEDGRARAWKNSKEYIIDDKGNVLTK